MIRNVVHTSQFRRDLKKAVKQGKKLSDLEEVVESLVYGKPLGTQYIIW